MKRPITFSIDEQICNNFLRIMEIMHKDRHDTIAALMSAFINQNTKNIYTKCAVCSAEYSQRLNACPVCEKAKMDKEITTQITLKEQQEKQAEEQKQREIESNRIEFMSRLNRIVVNRREEGQNISQIKHELETMLDKYPDYAADIEKLIYELQE